MCAGSGSLGAAGLESTSGKWRVEEAGGLIRGERWVLRHQRGLRVALFCWEKTINLALSGPICFPSEFSGNIFFPVSEMDYK